MGTGRVKKVSVVFLLVESWTKKSQKAVARNNWWKLGGNVGNIAPRRHPTHTLKKYLSRRDDPCLGQAQRAWPAPQSTKANFSPYIMSRTILVVFSSWASQVKFGGEHISPESHSRYSRKFGILIKKIVRSGELEKRLVEILCMVLWCPGKIMGSNRNLKRHLCIFTVFVDFQQEII